MCVLSSHIFGCGSIPFGISEVHQPGACWLVAQKEGRRTRFFWCFVLFFKVGLFEGAEVLGILIGLYRVVLCLTWIIRVIWLVGLCRFCVVL